MRTNANNAMTTATSTLLPEQREMVNLIQMVTQEACTCQMHGCANMLAQCCLGDILKKESVFTEAHLDSEDWHNRGI